MTDSQWQYFTVEELSCHCGKCGLGPESMDPDLMRRLVAIRRQLGFPLPISSAIRCPDHNDAVSESGRHGAHTTGKAVDILVEGAHCSALVSALYDHGVIVPGEAKASGRGGLGFSQKGAHGKRFLHVDMMPHDWPWGPRPWVWSY